MSDVIERIAYEIYGLDRSHVGEEYALTVAKAAARVLLEAQQQWERDNYGAGFDDTAMSVGYARYIGIDLTSPAAPEPKAEQ